MFLVPFFYPLNKISQARKNGRTENLSRYSVFRAILYCAIPCPVPGDQVVIFGTVFGQLRAASTEYRTSQITIHNQHTARTCVYIVVARTSRAGIDSMVRRPSLVSISGYHRLIRTYVRSTKGYLVSRKNRGRKRK